MVSPLPDNENAVRLAIRFEVDKRRLKEAIDGSKALQKDLQSFKQSTEQVNQVLEKEVLALQKAKIAGDKASGGLTPQFRKLTGELNKATDETHQLTQALTEAQREAQQLGQTDVTPQTAGVGKKSALALLGREVRGLPSIAIPGAGGLTTDAVGNILRVVGSLSKEGGLPTLAETASLAKTKIGEVVQAIGIGPIALVGAFGALALAIKLLEASASQGAQAITEQIEAAKKFNVQRTIGTTESITGDIEGQREELRKLGADLETARQAYALTVQEYLKNDPIKITVGAFTSGLGLDTPLNRAQKAFEDAKKAVEDQNTAIDLNIAAMQSESVLRNDINQLTQQYNDQLDKSKPVLEQLAQQHDQLTASFKEQIDQLEQDRALREQFQTEDRALQDQQRATAQVDRLIAIELAGQDRIVQLREQGIDALANIEGKRDDSIAKAIESAKQSEADETEKFRQEELKRGREFRRNEDRIAKEFQREQLRRAEDNKQELLDLEAANDVAGFIQAKRRQRTETKRAQEDFDTGKQQRLQDFEDERRERQIAKQERIDDIHAETQERTAAAIAEFAKEKTALQQKTDEAIEIEQEAIKARTDAAIAANEKETEALTASRERADNRAAILEGIQDSRRQASHDAALAQIDERKAAEDALFTDILHQITVLRQQLALPGANVPPLLPTGGGSSGTAFARGALSVDRPTFGVFGDVKPGMAEALIPYRKSEGIAAELARLGVSGGSAGNTYNMAGMFSGATIGGDVSQADLQALEQAVYMGVTSLRTGQAPGAA